MLGEGEILVWIQTFVQIEKLLLEIKNKTNPFQTRLIVVMSMVVKDE